MNSLKQRRQKHCVISKRSIFVGSFKNYFSNTFFVASLHRGGSEDNERISYYVLNNNK